MTGLLRPISKIFNRAVANQASSTHVTILATTKDKKTRSTVTISYPGDAGILFTAVLCVESALALAAGEGDEAGFSTPTMNLGERFVPRLQAAGVAITVDKVSL